MSLSNFQEKIFCDICNYPLTNFFSGFWHNGHISEYYTSYTCNCPSTIGKSPFCLDNKSTGIFFCPEDSVYKPCLILKNKNCLILFICSKKFIFSYCESSLKPKEALHTNIFDKFNAEFSKKDIAKNVTKILPLIRKDLITYNNNLIFI